VGPERGPLSLVSTTEELLVIKISGSGLENENTVIGIRHADHVAPLSSQKVALTTARSGVRVLRPRSLMSYSLKWNTFPLMGSNVRILCPCVLKQQKGGTCAKAVLLKAALNAVI
jgi:hypothetical protein